MEDLANILKNHYLKRKSTKPIALADKVPSGKNPTFTEIPDVFFDIILPQFKLSRIEVMVLLFFYRRVWSGPNLHKVHGISDILSLEKVYNQLSITRDELFHSITKLESLGFIETIRSGQYFVRKYFTEDLDRDFGQNYDDFL